MSRSKTPKPWTVVTIKTEPEVAVALDQFAAANGISRSQAGRDLLRGALRGEGALRVEADLADRGYREGFRRGRKDYDDRMRQIAEEERVRAGRDADRE